MSRTSEPGKAEPMVFLIASAVCDLYQKNGGRGVFKRVFVFWHSVNVDPAWHPVKKLMKEVWCLRVNIVFDITIETYVTDSFEESVKSLPDKL
jgi:hypothetical protein